MRRTTIFLPESLERDLKLHARRAGVPVASIVREAVAAYIVDKRGAASRLPSFAAIGASGRSDTADRHEDLLWRDPEHSARRAPRRRTRSKRRR